MKNQKMKKLFVTVLLVAFLTSIISVIPVQASTVGLVGEWKLDEGIGSIAHDETVNDNDGVLSGGKFGNALYFNGVNSYVEIPDASSLDVTGDITIEAWILIKGFSTSEGLHMYTVGKDSTAGRSYGIGVDLAWVYPKRPFVIVFHPGGGYQIAWGSADLSANVWYHIAGVFNAGADELTLYVNGVPQQTAIDTNTIYASSSNLRIGARQYAGAQCFFNGIIDEVRISNVARYTAGFTPSLSPFDTDTNTAGLWHFDESVGTTAFDSSDNHNDGTIVNEKWVGPVWVAGRTGSMGDYALKFDGIDDYVKVPDQTILDLGVGTWEAWLNFDAKPSAVHHMMNPLAKANQYWIHASDGYDDPFDLESIARVDSIQAKITIGGTRYIVSTAATFIETGVWYHVVGTYDGSHLRLCINGELVDEKAVTGTIDAGGQILAFGTWSAPTDYFKGVIDDVQLWNIGLASLHLEFDTSSDTIVPVGTSANLKVCLTAADGTPVEGMTIEFSSTPTLTIPSSVITLADGCATVQANGAAGLYTITATVETCCGTVSADWTIVIYDTNGMAAGGGWYVPLDEENSEMDGRATFGFIAKYIKGKSTGNLEFQYHSVEGFNLKSIAIDFLVVTGGKIAQFGGTATKDGQTGYYFRVKAIDNGEPGTLDEFWIKIWEGDIIAAETTDPIYNSHNTLSGGNIMVKTK